MKIALRDLAAFVGGRIEGDENTVIESFGPIDQAAAGSITFLANPKYTHLIYTSKASAVLVSDSFKAEQPISTTLLRVKDPYTAIAKLMSMAQRFTVVQPIGVEQPCRLPADFVLADGVYIGAFAYIADDVKIASGVKIYPNSYIGRGVEIGADTVINAGVRIYPDCKIGARCILHSGAVVGADGFGFAPNVAGEYEKIPQLGRVVIEDDVEIGANATVDRATFGETVIRSGTKIDNLVQVGHNVQIGKNNVLCAQVGVAGSTNIGNNNVIAGQVGIAGHIKIGDHNTFGAQSGIPNNVGDNKRLLGYPAVDARQFAKNQVFLKKIGKLFEEGKL